MFVAWKTSPLSSHKYERTAWCDCPHDKTPGAVRWAPLVCVAERVQGKPRRRVVYRLGVSIRPCCAAETAAPFVRARFWAAIERALLKAPAEVQAQRKAIVAAIAARVPEPSYLEDLISSHRGPVCCSYGRTRYETEQNKWAAVLKAVREEIGRDCRQREASQQARDPWADFEESFRSSWEDAWRRAQESAGAGRWTGFSADPEPVPPASISVLGLRWPTTREAIGKAYRTLAIKHHPDRGGDNATMVRINQARDEALAYLAKLEARRAA